MRAAGDQAKTECGNLQLFAVLEAGIEGATHNVGQRRLEMVGQRRHKEEEADVTEGGEEEGGEGIVESINNLNIETGGTEEEAAEVLEAVLGRAAHEMELDENRGRGE